MKWLTRLSAVNYDHVAQVTAARIWRYEARGLTKNRPRAPDSDASTDGK